MNEKPHGHGSEPKTTAGIPPIQKGALSVLQFANMLLEEGQYDTVMPNTHTETQIRDAAWEVATYHAPTGNQASRHKELSEALTDFLTSIVNACPPSPERSTAISRAREAKMWASAAIALEST